MKNFGRLLMIASAVVVSYSIPRPAMAQVINSTAGTVTLNATLAESLTVNVTSGTTVNIPLTPNTATNAGTSTSSVTTAWVLKPGRTAVSLWAWVANSGAALTDTSSDNIPASAVTAAASGFNFAGGPLNTVLSGGSGVPAFITGAAATGVQIGGVAVSGINKSGSGTATIAWNINTTFNAQLPAGNYAGTVNIQAQATP